ncbi:MAG: nucleoside hydrolase [Clostridia bacterium]|nr:nucleoside hydrolase [Clostridia bacterium]
MTELQRIRMLEPPTGCVDMVLDTDAFNEVDDQFAIAYALRSTASVNLCALYAAPFYNAHSTSPADGMERSYHEIHKVLALAERTDLADQVYRGCDAYLPDEKTPLDSPAVRDLVERARRYSPEKPLYVAAVGCITDVASAILTAPDIIENIVVVWLGGHAWHFEHTKEFNMKQDIAAARVVFGCGVPLVQLPCYGVWNPLRTNKPELLHWFADKNPLSDYLARNMVEEAERWSKLPTWGRVIWDVTAVAWIADREGMLTSVLRHAPIPEYDGYYSEDASRHFMRFVSGINRDALMWDLVKKLTGAEG